MTNPLLTKSLSKHLKRLNQPVVWVPLSVFVLICLGIWQYYARQPGGPGRGSGRELGQLEPSSAGDSLETGSPALSEIDTLELLLESSRGAANPAATNQQIATDLPSDLALATPTGQSSTGPSSQPSDQSDPFAAYRAEYQFQSGSSAAIAGPTQPATSASGRVNFGAGLVNPAAPSTNSALSEALKRQQATREQSREQGSSQTENLNRVTPSQLDVRSGPDGTNIAGDRAATELNRSADRISNPLGSPTTAPYTSTTPGMSPPVGTTGYQRSTTVPLPSSTLPAQNLNSTFTPSSLPAAPAANTPSILYTPPAFTQPDQGRPINPRQ